MGKEDRQRFLATGTTKLFLIIVYNMFRGCELFIRVILQGRCVLYTEVIPDFSAEAFQDSRVECHVKMF